jgi:ABC-type dipeptide/oligopeptide/nickel transport system permease subunit
VNYASAEASAEGSAQNAHFRLDGEVVARYRSNGIARPGANLIQRFDHTSFTVAAAGVRNRKIITRHVMPNVLGPVIVYVTLTVPQVILIPVVPVVPSLGVQEPLTSWGVLIAEGAAQMESAPGS